MRKLLLGVPLLVCGCFSVANVPTPKACKAGEASRYDGSTWLCETLPVAPAAQVCEASTYPFWDGTKWKCVAFPLATPVPCPDGFYQAWTESGGWTCKQLPADLGSELSSPVTLAAGFNPAFTIPANTPAVAVSMSATLPGAPLATSGGPADPGCLTVTHNWNTNAVGYTAWYSDISSGTRVWLPVPAQANLGMQNLALNKMVKAEPTTTLADPVLLVDGSDSTVTGFATPASVIPTGSLTIDLQASYPLSLISVNMDLRGRGGSGTQEWHASLSDFPGASAGATLIASGTCPAGQLCAVSTPLTGSPSGRYLTWTCDQNWGNSTSNFCLVNEIQAYAVAGFSISQPDANSVRLCNYSGSTRDLALRVAR